MQDPQTELFKRNDLHIEAMICDEVDSLGLDVDKDWLIDELRPDFEDIEKQIVDRRVLRFAIRTLALKAYQQRLEREASELLVNERKNSDTVTSTTEKSPKNRSEGVSEGGQ